MIYVDLWIIEQHKRTKTWLTQQKRELLLLCPFMTIFPIKEGMENIKAKRKIICKQTAAHAIISQHLKSFTSCLFSISVHLLQNVWKARMAWNRCITMLNNALKVSHLSKNIWFFALRINFITLVGAILARKFKLFEWNLLNLG